MRRAPQLGTSSPTAPSRLTVGTPWRPIHIIATHRCWCPLYEARSHPYGGWRGQGKHSGHLTEPGSVGCPAGCVAKELQCRLSDPVQEGPCPPGPAPGQSPQLPVGESQPEYVIYEQPQGLHRPQKHNVADVKLHPPHVFSKEQDRTFNVLAHNLEDRCRLKAALTSPGPGQSTPEAPRLAGCALTLVVRSHAVPTSRRNRPALTALSGPVPGHQWRDPHLSSPSFSALPHPSKLGHVLYLLYFN